MSLSITNFGIDEPLFLILKLMIVAQPGVRHAARVIAITSRYSASTLVVSPTALLWADHRRTSSLRRLSCRPGREMRMRMTLGRSWRGRSPLPDPVGTDSQSNRSEGHTSDRQF